MKRTRMHVTTVAMAAIAAAGLLLAGCGSNTNPLNSSAGSSSSESSGAQSSGAGSGGASSTAGGSGGSETSPATGSTEGGGAGQTSPGSTGTGQQQVVIGSANFTESELIADIYAAALKAAGVPVTTHLNIGAREVYLQAMHEGSINLLPEYTGGLLAYYDKTSPAHSPQDVYAALQKALPADLEVLKYSAAQDQDSVTVTKATADKYHLVSIGDLAPVAGQMTLGGSSEWQTRADGPTGMAKLYGVTFKDYKVLDPGGPLSVKGLLTGLVQATDIFTTDPAIEENNFVVLKDPKNLFLAQNVVPLIAKSVATPQVTGVLDAVSAKLTTTDLTDMQKTINDTKANVADVASTWVSKNGLG